MQYLLPILSLFFITNSYAQQSHQLCGKQLHYSQKSYLDYSPCGTPAFKTKWMQDYHKNPAIQQKGSTNTTTYLPLSLHIVGNDDSTGYGSLPAILAAFCQVNRDYKSTGIQFFIEGSIDYISNSDFNRHDSIIVGGGFMLQYNVPNTTNCYFVADPAGNCGYNVLYGGLTVGYSCISGHTFSHELGHALGLQHPFYGWEGGHGYNGSYIQVFNSAAPTEVLLDYTVFKDTMWSADTVIVDTALVEIVARTGPTANCHIAADGFCDTDADYLAYRWACNGTGNSSVQQLDPDTVAFYSKAWNIMSYSFDNCQTSFSAEQSAYANSFVQTQRPGHLYNQNPIIDSIAIADLNLLEPAAGTILPTTTGITFRWNSVPGATHYILKVCASPCGSANLDMEEILLTDTSYISSLVYNPRISIFPYRWKVIPFNQSYTCAGQTPKQTFNTQTPTNLRAIENVSSFNAYPNPLGSGQSLQLEATTTTITNTTLRLYNVTGQIIKEQGWNLQKGSNSLSFSTTDLAPGVYLLFLEGKQGRMVQKLVIQR